MTDTAPDVAAARSAAYRLTIRWAGPLRTTGGGLLFFAGMILLWDLWVRWAEIPPYIMPTPAAVWTTLVAEWGQVSDALLYTVRSAVFGLSVATVLALSLASLFVASATATRAILPLVIVIRTAPVLAIAPILIMNFGRGLTTSIIVVVIVAFFPIMVNAMRGLRATRRNALELMHVLGAGGVTTFLKVRFPFALPYIFTGLRASAASAFLSAMLAEWLSGAPGLGWLILDAAAFVKLDLMWSAVFVSMAMAMTVFFVTATLERRFTRWA